MFKRVLLILISMLLWKSDIANAEGMGNIEIFSIDQEAVVKQIKSEYEIQKVVENYINGIEGIYARFNPIPNSGFAIKIPLNPAIKAEAKGINAAIDQVIIMFPINEQPFLMIFETEDKLACFNFRGGTEFLLESLDYEPGAK